MGWALVIVAFIVYIPAMQGGYIWDDDDYVLKNQTLLSLDGLRQIWFQIGATPQYYPMVHSTYWLEYRLWGLIPSGYHTVNILLHAVNAVLLWRVLAALHIPGAWVAAVVFALHPVHVESVAWITERKNVLSCLFYLSAALAYLRYALGANDKEAHTGSGKFYALSLVLFLCALLSKTVTSTLPAALLLLLWWKRGRIQWADVRAMVPFFFVGIGFGLLTLWMEKHHVGAVGEAWNLSLVERLLIAGRALWFYAGKLLWPSPLIFNYPRWQIDGGAWQQYLYPAGALAVMVALWLARSRIGRGPLAAVLFFAGTLMPALGFFDVFPMRYSFVADHFQYHASIGLITIFASVGCLAANRLGGWGRTGGWGALVIVLATLGTLTWRQSYIYKNHETIWRDTIRKNPDSWMAHTNLGVLLTSRDRLEEAMGHYRQSLRINAADYVAHNGLGSALRDQGQTEEAIGHYREALRINAANSTVHNNLGLTLLQLGRMNEAMGHFREALRINPGDFLAHNNLGIALAMQGVIYEAVDHFREALRIDPANISVYDNLAGIYASRGEWEKAIELYRKALKVNPGVVEFHEKLGRLLTQTGRKDEAIPYFEEALRLMKSGALQGH